MSHLLKKAWLVSLVPIVSSIGVMSAEASDSDTYRTLKVSKNTTDFPTALPVYKVTGQGISRDRLDRLTRAFNLKSPVLDKYGAAHFSDVDAFLSLPMKELAPDNYRDSEDEGGLVYEGFDYDAIAKIRVMDLKQTAEKVSDVFRELDLLPRGATPLVSHSRFEVVSTKGDAVVDQPIDTAISYRFSLSDIPLEGPGANIRVAFGSEGNVTQLSYAYRSLEAAGESDSFVGVIVLPDRITSHQ